MKRLGCSSLRDIMFRGMTLKHDVYARFFPHQMQFIDLERQFIIIV